MFGVTNLGFLYFFFFESRNLSSRWGKIGFYFRSAVFIPGNEGNRVNIFLMSVWPLEKEDFGAFSEGDFDWGAASVWRISC